MQGSNSQAGVFHPKIVFQVGRDGARVVVGSANATSAGIGGNREVVSQVECTGIQSPERAFVVAVWNYLADIVEDTPGPTRDALHWLETHTPWLAQAPDDPAVRSWTLADDTRLGFIANTQADDRSILDKFVAEIAGASIERLVVMSPYWDEGLIALRSLIGALKPAETIVLIQPGEKQFPVDAARGLDVVIKELAFGDAGDSPQDRRFSHAKVVIAIGGGSDHLLSGSANCTLAAMGSVGRRGQNAEACIYRRLPAGTILASLQLERALAGPALTWDEIPALREELPLPLEEAAASWPGSFEMDFNQILWRPAPGVDVGAVRIELLDSPNAEPLSVIEPKVWRSSAGLLMAKLVAGAEASKFARALSSDGYSGLTIIARREALRSRRKERHASSVERAAAALQECGTLDMRHLELLDILERADQDAQATLAIPRRMMGSDRAKTEAEQPQQLGYDAFLRVRQPLAPSGGESGVVERNTLAGGSVDVMRGFLNDLTYGRGPRVEEEFLEETLPDDGGSAAADPDSGDGESGGKVTRSVKVKGAEVSTDTAQTRPPVDAKALEKAVMQYWKVVQAQAKAGAIGSSQVLRLRLWLMLLLANRKQLACDASECGWPRLVVRVLSAFFTGGSPPIKNLAIDPRYDRVPDDFIETWVAALTALEALSDCSRAIGNAPGGSAFVPFVSRINATVRSLVGLTAEDLKDPRVIAAGESLKSYLNSDRDHPDA